MSQPPESERRDLPARVDEPVPSIDDAPPLVPEVVDETGAASPTPLTTAPPPEPFVILPVWGLWTVVALSAIYLGNFTMGVDILPDALPVVGNLDEVVAFLLGQQAWLALQTGSSRIFRRKD